ncbi:MAG: protein kinase, partial [Sandaracinaceae bacterium]|nr:protein kinase [Sandaracinaceae bacterium]
MTRPFTKQLGELRVERTLEDDVAAPCVEAVDPDGRRFRARVLAIPGAEPDALARFEGAAAAAATLAHPSLEAPQRYARGPLPFVASAWRERASLGPLATAPLEPARVTAIGLDVAAALAAAHAASVVHGGVGLGAIGIDAGGRALLGDFAIGELVASLAQAHSQVLGTAAIALAPEHLAGGAPGPATDVFALGSTLYRLLTGAFPFEAPSPLAMTLKLQMGTYDSLDERAPSAPAPLRALIHAMLATDPSARPSAADVAAGLRAIAPPDEARAELLQAWVAPVIAASPRPP